MAKPSMSLAKIVSLVEALSNTNITINGNINIEIQTSATPKSKNLNKRLNQKIAILATRRRLHFATYRSLCRKIQGLSNDHHGGGPFLSVPIAQADGSPISDNLKVTTKELSRRAQELNHLLVKNDEAHAGGLACDRRIEKFSRIRDGKSSFPQPKRIYHESFSLGSQVGKNENDNSNDSKCPNLDKSGPKHDAEGNKFNSFIQTPLTVSQTNSASSHLDELGSIDSKRESTSSRPSALAPFEDCHSEQKRAPAIHSIPSGSTIKNTELMICPTVTTEETTPSLCLPRTHYSIIAPNMIDAREPRFLPHISSSDQQEIDDIASSKAECRAVMILNIPGSFDSLSSVLSRVRGGMITRASLVTLGSQWRFHESEIGQKQGESCRMAYIEFALPLHAEAYVEYMNGEKSQNIKRAMLPAAEDGFGTKVTQQNIQIQLVGTPSYPLSASIQRAIHEKGVTRNIAVSFSGYTVSATCDKIEKCIDLLARRFQGPSPFKAGRGWGKDALFEDILIDYDVIEPRVDDEGLSCAPSQCGPGSVNQEDGENDTDSETEPKVNLLLRFNFLKIEHAIKAMSTLKYNIVLMPSTSERGCQQDHRTVTVYYSADECAGPLGELQVLPLDREKEAKSLEVKEDGRKRASILQMCRSVALAKTVEDIILGRECKTCITVDDVQNEVDLLGLHHAVDELNKIEDKRSSDASSPSIWSCFSVKPAEEDSEETGVAAKKEGDLLGEAQGQQIPGILDNSS